jgi:hypothetical protein
MKTIWPTTIRMRLACCYAGALALTLLTLGVAIDVLMHRRLLARTDFELDEELHELRLEVRLAESEAELLRQLGLRFADHASFEFIISRSTGERLFASRRVVSAAAPATAFPADAEPAFGGARLPGLGAVRLATQRTPGPAGELIVQALMPMDINLAELRDLRRLLWTLCPLAVLASLAGGYWLAGRALAPVDRMTQAGSRRSAWRSGWRRRIPMMSWGVWRPRSTPCWIAWPGRWRRCGNLRPTPPMNCGLRSR